MPMIINAGIPGDSSAEILARVGSVLSAEPDLVVVKAGTNDALNARKLVEPTVLAANLAAIAEVVRGRCRLLLVTPLPFHEPYLLARHGGIQAYGAIPPLDRQRLAVAAARALGAALGVPVVDAWRVFTGVGLVGEDPRSLLRNVANSGVPDGVHPTGDGYRVLASAIAQAILAGGLPHRRIACLGDSITNGQYVPGAGTAEGETYPAWLARILA